MFLRVWIAGVLTRWPEPATVERRALVGVACMVARGHDLSCGDDIAAVAYESQLSEPEASAALEAAAAEGWIEREGGRITLREPRS